MKKRIAWLVVSGWMVTALLVASCAPAVVEEEAEKVTPPVEEEEVMVPEEEVTVPEEEVTVPEEEGEWVKWTGTKTDGTVVEKMIEKPRYGGTHTRILLDYTGLFDDVALLGAINMVPGPVNETLQTMDWTRSPAGTGEWRGVFSIYPYGGNKAGQLMESWELVKTPEADTFFFHIRKGIHWQNIPPVNGREFTATDVVFTLRRQFGVGFLNRAYRHLVDMENLGNSIYVSPDDKWTVVAKCRPNENGAFSTGATTYLSKIIAPEVVGGHAGELAGEKYKTPISDWRNVVGTGPWIIEEHIPFSVTNYVRNPDYWMHDPFFPENQLPYMDRLRILLVPEVSTALSGLRTGKIDTLKDLDAESAQSLMKTNPELEWVSHLGKPENINMRNDTKPFDDVRVRRALWLAIDLHEMRDVYFDGKADVLSWPIRNAPEYKGYYIPLEEHPESVQELYKHNPDKARQLLAEAGYPEGFETDVVCYSSEQIDLLSIIKQYWAEIGVDLNLDVKPYNVHQTMAHRFTHKQMLMKQGASSIYVLRQVRPTGSQNQSIIRDPEVEELYMAIQANYWDWAKVGRLYTEPTATRPNYIEYFHEQAWFIPLPAPYFYKFWQPWIKGFYGADDISAGQYITYAKHIWIDQELKETMAR